MSSGFVISEIDIDRCMNDRHRYNSDSWADVPDVIKVILNGETGRRIIKYGQRS